MLILRVSPNALAPRIEHLAACPVSREFSLESVQDEFGEGESQLPLGILPSNIAQHRCSDGTIEVTKHCSEVLFSSMHTVGGNKSEVPHNAGHNSANERNHAVGHALMLSYSCRG
jgi:hypothetical protein